jgi:histone-lysine N-methyltransferase SETMAR
MECQVEKGEHFRHILLFAFNSGIKAEVLPHPPYSPDLAPSDFHLFRSLQNHLNGKTFKNDEELKNWLDEFFDSEPAAFFKSGMDKLPGRWEYVVNNEGAYVVD